MPRPEQEVRVVREQRPGVDRERPPLRQRRDARDEVRAIPIVPEDHGPLDPPHHHVVEGVRRIEAGLPRHGTREASTL